MSKLLIVDDEPNILEALNVWLTDRGHQITRASSGNAAIQLLPKVQPDLILTDVQMSPGDGFAVLLAAKRYDPLLAVIMMTGNLTSAEHCAKAMKLGADDYLCKPFDLPDLERRIAYALKYRQARQAKNPQPGRNT